ncbi:MAG: homoserine dehydrogenase [Spirochaetia bacterium]
MKTVGVALLGCGTVGSRIYHILKRDKELFEKKCGISFRITGVTGRRPESLVREKIDPGLFKTAEQNIDFRGADVVVELMGGIHPAAEAVTGALRQKKPVVTANKALLSEQGQDLISLAQKNGVTLAFEASCCAGVPVVRAITDGLSSNRIDAIFGIVNGTCNYILTRMIHQGIDYNEALKKAQEEGLAEADPALDVSGMDSAQKLTILSGLAFGGFLPLASVSVKGIDTLERMDVEFAGQLGYVVKLLAIASRIGSGICLRVRPSFITKEHPLAWVSGPFNAVSLYGGTTGHTMYYGRGAGGDPTASAVISDLISTASGMEQAKFSYIADWFKQKEPEMHTTGEIRSRYYIRVLVKDQPGSLGRITTILGKHDISIASFLQHELPESEDTADGCEFAGKVPIVLTTHTVKEQNIINALKEIEQTEQGCGGTEYISIVDEHPERIQQIPVNSLGD